MMGRSSITGQQTFWQRKQASVASTYPDETLKTRVAGWGGLADWTLPDDTVKREPRVAAPQSSQQVFTPERWGLLRDSAPELEITPYSFFDKTLENNRFATFINPRTGRGVE